MVTEPVGGAFLTDAEQALVEHVAGGEVLDLAADEPAMRTWDSAQTIRATVLRDILRGRLAPDPDPHGIRLRGARITGRLDLEYLTTSVAVELRDCLLDEGLVASSAKLPALVLAGCRLEHPALPPLEAQELTTSVLLLDGAVIVAACEIGGLRVADAHLDALGCTGATLHNSRGPAVAAERLQVSQGVFLRGGFEAVGAGGDGAVLLAGAHIHGMLDCSGATLRNDSGPALNAYEMQVDQGALLVDKFMAISGGIGPHETLNLANVRIGGVLGFAPARLEHTGDPHARLFLDGLIYPGLPRRIAPHDWLRLLREATPWYAAQPYQQLAAAHRAAGHDGEARRVLMAQRRDQIDRKALTGRAERAWARLTGLTLGYGYQPWRALLTLVAVATTAVVLALLLGAHGGVARVDPHPAAATRCSVVERIGVGLDLGLPLIKTGTRDHCDTTASTSGQVLTAAGWGLQLLAWAFATLFVAGFTGAVRKT
jgi:hypothetical protein